MSNFVTIQNENFEIKKKNLFLTANFIWFTWIFFHFTIIFFFWLILKSVFLVWLFLWIWNLIAMILDIPIWILQKYFRAKNLLIISSVLMLFIWLIFLKFIYFTSIDLWVGSGVWEYIWGNISYITNFLDSWFNIVLVLIAAIFYWVVKETFDITNLSYILDNSNPNEYAWLISKYNINFWIWGFTWLLLSWFILAFSIKIAVTFLIFIIICLLVFIINYYDNWSKTVTMDEFMKLKVYLKDNYNNVWEIKNKIFTRENFKTLSKKTKFIFIKSIETKQELNFSEIKNQSINSFNCLKEVLFGLPRKQILIWTFLVIISFWFWDTFIATFQVDFLNKVIINNKEWIIVKSTSYILSWYLLLGLMVIPAFWLQGFFINLAKKIWFYNIITIWILISSISIFLFWIFEGIIFIIIFWITNSIWYAASMPLAQWIFSENYNEIYAEKYNLTQIDSNTSAAPLKIILNFANVLWLIIWWLLVWVLWFNSFFLVFGIFLVLVFIYSIINKNLIIQKNKEINLEENTSEHDF